MTDYGAFAFLVKESEVTLEGPLPSPEEVLYAPPNPDGSRKKCGNCWKFLPSSKGDGGTCLEVQGDIESTEVCGYHVYGTPTGDRSLIPATRLTQAVAGLVSTKNDGSSCDVCLAFDSGTSTCKRVQKGGKLAKVEAKGCCGRWHEKG